ncbi:hypothetical protein HQ590_01590 [bacterium]|nr:hypothetical protein [bacterium]
MRSRPCPPRGGHRHLRIWWLVIVLVGGGVLPAAEELSPPSPAAIPVKPGASTAQEFSLLVLRVYERTTVQAYPRVGRHDPRWDDAAREYLGHCARYAVAAPGAPTASVLREAGGELVANGCDDPLVLSCHAQLLEKDDATRAEAEALLERAVPLFEAHPYPESHRLAALVSLAALQARRQDTKAYYAGIPALFESLRQVITGDEYRGDEVRVRYRDIKPALGRLRPGELGDLYERVRDHPGVDPWLTKLIGGDYHLRTGWAARGTEYADKVSRESWKSLNKELLAAQGLLTAAWNERPEYPEAATLMITVANALGSAAAANPRAWFDRAVAAQFDYQQAYAGYLWTLRPRWGGSHEAMYEFGLECRQTGRYETYVPWQLIRALLSIGSDYGDYRFWRRPGVYENMKSVMEQTAAHSQHRGEAASLKSVHAAVAWHVGRWAEARALLDDLGDRAEPKAFGNMNAPYVATRAEVYALTGPLAAQIRAAQELRQQGDRQEALRRITELMETGQPDVDTREYLRTLAVALRLEVATEADRWVDLTFQPELSRWRQVGGQWQVEDERTILGQPDGHGLALICPADFGDRFALRADVEFVHGRRHLVNAGFYFNYVLEPEWSYWANVILNPNLNAVSLRQRFVPERDDWPTPFTPTNSLCLEVWDDELTIIHNQVPVVAGHPLVPRRSAAPYLVGLGGMIRKADVAVRFRNVQVRRLRQKLSAPLLQARDQLQDHLEKLDRLIAAELWTNALGQLDAARQLSADESTRYRLEQLQRLVALRPLRADGRAQLLFEDTFAGPLNPKWKVNHADPGLTMQPADGALAIRGKTTLDQWLTTGLSCEIPVDKIVEIAMDIRLPAPQGLVFVAALGMSHFFEGRYMTNPQGRKRIGGTPRLPAFRDEMNRWHTLRLVLDRPRGRIYTYVDYQFMAELEVREMPPTATVTIGFQHPHPGATIHVLIDNFRVNAYPD